MSDLTPQKEGPDTLLEIERRCAERYPCLRRPAVRVLAKPSFQPHHAIVRDVSIRSIGLIVEKPFSNGTILAIQMQTRHAGFSGILSAQVQHSTQQRDGTWFLGCTLSRSLTDDEIFQLL
jgi:hypothetical protein